MYDSHSRTIESFGTKASYEKVVRLNIVVYEVLMNTCDLEESQDHAFCEWCFHRELATARIEQLLKTWAKEVYRQEILKSFLVEVINLRYSSQT